jgi:4-hydroxy-3-polyprenylbenzoate decarboxylase
MRKIVVGISGATGVVYGVRMLKALFENGVETHLVITSSAIRNMLIETEYTMADLDPFASTIYDVDDVGAAIASGSFQIDGMVIAPLFYKDPFRRCKFIQLQSPYQGCRC